MKNLNEFNSAYPNSISNSQSQEYNGVFAPYDAETVQGKDRLNPKDSEGLHRINAFIKYFFRRTTANPQYEVAQLKVRLNHMNLDFPQPTKLDDNQDIEVTTGTETFGVTPTTDLSKGFYKGEDLPKYNLNLKVNKTDAGYKIDAKLTPKGEVAESIIYKNDRTKRINTIKEMMNGAEIGKAKTATDIKSSKEKETVKFRKKEDRELKN